jgi:hypothetical protein
MSIKFELGKFYRTRGGRKALVFNIVSGDEIYPLRVAIIGLGTTACMGSGRIWVNKESPNDLIAEWIDADKKGINNPIIYDRAKLPAWANKAIAMNANGRWRCFSEVPLRSATLWLPATRKGELEEIRPGYEPNWQGDWKDSLLVFED